MGTLVSAVIGGTSSPRPDTRAWLSGCFRNSRSNGRRLSIDAVNTTRFTEGVASAASRMVCFPITACDTRSPGVVAPGDAT